jgi:hypothetical protein
MVLRLFGIFISLDIVLALITGACLVAYGELKAAEVAGLLSSLFRSGEEAEHPGAGGAHTPQGGHADFDLGFHIVFRAEIAALDIGDLRLFRLEEVFEDGDRLVGAAVLFSSWFFRKKMFLICLVSMLLISEQIS